MKKHKTKKEIREEIGLKIRNYRKNVLRLRIDQFIKLYNRTKPTDLNISTTPYISYEKGRTPIPSDKLEKLWSISAGDITPEDLNGYK